MAQKLLINSAATVQLGPFLDATDGVSAETGIDLTTAVVELSKNGAAFSTGSGTSGTHDQQGWYRFPLSAGDIDTLGRLIVKSDSSGVHLPVWREFDVVSSAFFNSFYSTVPQPVDVNRWNTSAATTLAIAVVDSPANLSTLLINSSGEVTLSTISPAISSQISSQVWNYSTRSLTTVTAAQSSQIGRAVWDSTVTEPSSGPFEWTGNHGAIMEWVGALSRNQIDQSSVDQILRADSTGTIISSARTSGSSTVFVRGEWSS